LISMICSGVNESRSAYMSTFRAGENHRLAQVLLFQALPITRDDDRVRAEAAPFHRAPQTAA
jgi:hypothetical protein